MADPITQSTQYLRFCQLLIVDAKNKSIDLSQLHIKFNIKHSNNMTPNIADFKIYNLAEVTIQAIQKDSNTKTILFQGGYQNNKGVVFQGDIKQILRGKEGATENYIEVIAGDSERAYNFATISPPLNGTLAKGCTSTDQINLCIKAFNKYGVTAGYINNQDKTQLPAGKTLYGNAKDILRDLANSTQHVWSIQDGKINYLPQKALLPGQAIVLTSKTGMIGTPEQTNEGVNVKCLLNPYLKPGGYVKIDNKSIAQFKIDLATPNSPANIPPPLNADGSYQALIIEHEGDNRGIEWYSTIVCLSIAVSVNPINAVQVNYA